MKNERYEKNYQKEKIYPSMRVYLSLQNEANDQLNVNEFLMFVEKKGIAEFVRELIDNGVLNVYYCCFDERIKVL